MTATVVFFIVIVFAIAVFDVYIIFKKGKGEAISAYIIRWSKDYPMLTLGFGILIGHLFWSMESFDHLPKEELIERCKEVLGAID